MVSHCLRAGEALRNMMITLLLHEQKISIKTKINKINGYNVVKHMYKWYTEKQQFDKNTEADRTYRVCNNNDGEKNKYILYLKFGYKK